MDRTANLRCAIRKRFAYHLPRTKICHFFARIQRELDVPGVLCSPQVRGKLINRAPLTRRMRTAQRVSSALVYTRFYIVKDVYLWTLWSPLALWIISSNSQNIFSSLTQNFISALSFIFIVHKVNYDKCRLYMKIVLDWRAYCKVTFVQHPAS